LLLLSKPEALPKAEAKQKEIASRTTDENFHAYLVLINDERLM